MAKNKHPTATAVDKHIAQRLRAARTSAEMSQTEAGKILGVTFQQLQKYEKGTNRVGAGALAVLARIYGRPVGWFFEGAPDSLVIDGQAARPDIVAEILATPHAGELINRYLQLSNQDRRVVVDVAAALAGRASSPASMPSAAE